VVEEQAPHELQGLVPLELELHYLHGLIALRAILNFELNFLTFLQGLEALALNFTVMHEYITAQFRGNESITFLVTEPLDCASCHSSSPPFFENCGEKERK
jgi:hypothetical protein